MKFPKRYLIKICGLTFLLLFAISCEDETITDTNNFDSSFTHEQKVTIIGYTSDAMEPFISKDDKYLFFNNLDGPNNKDIYYAEKVNDTTFEFKGEVQGINTTYVDANPTMDIFGKVTDKGQTLKQFPLNFLRCLKSITKLISYIV